jgi:hypothetical protein
MYNNHESIQKDKTRNILLKAIKLYLNPTKLVGFSLPSSNFIFEKKLLAMFKNSTLDCVERDKEVYIEGVKTLRGTANIRFREQEAFDFLKESEKHYNFIWLDLCAALNPTDVNNFLSVIQSNVLQKEAIVAVTFMSRRETSSKKMQNFYGASIAEFRNKKFPELVKYYCKQAARRCKKIQILHYKSELTKYAAPMNLYIFKITQNKQK